jgi:hypothetical protein
MRAARLGDDIDDFCVKCKRVMNHSVVSILNDEQAPPPKVDPRKAALFNQVLGNVTGLPPEPEAAPVDGVPEAAEEKPKVRRKAKA